MDQIKLKHKLEEVEILLPEKQTDSLIFIAIGLGGKRKPIVLLNSMMDVYYLTKPFGLVLKYAADPRNLHDRTVFNRLNSSSVFEEFTSEKHGYEGKHFHKYYGLEKKQIIAKVKEILETLDDLIVLDECVIHKSASKKDQ